MSRSILAALLALAVAGCSSDDSDPGDVTVPGCEVTNTCEPPPCEPSCTGHECGDDGCGGSCGSCGTCAPADTCEAFACVPTVEEPPPDTACPDGRSCTVAVHEAWSWHCVRPDAGAEWECTRLFLENAAPSAAISDMTCTGGESACNEADTDVGEACRRCEAGCTTPVYESCPSETPDVCAAPCACR